MSLLSFIVSLKIIVFVFVNISMDLKVTGCGLDWIDLAQDRDIWRDRVKKATKFRVS